MTTDHDTGERVDPSDRPDIDRALLNPAAVFASPEDVLQHVRLTRAEKIKVLQRWEYDASEMDVAKEEGMIPPSEDDLLRRILLALGQLTDSADAERSGPTKHGVSQSDGT